MDQLKPILAVIGKCHFWILCGVVLIAALVVYTTASGSLSKQYIERTDQINSSLQAGKTVGTSEDTANDRTIEAARQETLAVKDDVLKAWEFLYDLQKKNNPWPKVLGANFLNEVNSLGPTQKIDEPYRRVYWTFIRNHFESLLEIINVRHTAVLDEDGKVVNKIYDISNKVVLDIWQPKFEAGTHKREERGIVIWKHPEALDLGRDWPPNVCPNTIQVRMAQEDLWVYEALLRIIRDTNKTATSYYNASIKQIDAMHIGTAASHAFSGMDTISTAGGGMESDYSGEEEYDEGYDEDYGYEDEMDVGGYVAGMDTGEKLLEGRYVDLNYKPLNFNAHPIAEFKMMPVRLVFKMAQQHIPTLLANCANSSMPVEVCRVTIRPGEGGSLNLGGMTALSTASGSSYDDEGYDEEDVYEEESYDDEGYGDESYGDESYGMDDYSSSSSGSYASTAGGQILPDSDDLTVEVLGVIYIFNQPDRDKLGTGTGTGAVE